MECCNGGVVGDTILNLITPIFQYSFILKDEIFLCYKNVTYSFKDTKQGRVRGILSFFREEESFYIADSVSFRLCGIDWPGNEQRQRNERTLNHLKCVFSRSQSVCEPRKVQLHQEFLFLRYFDQGRIDEDIPLWLQELIFSYHQEKEYLEMHCSLSTT